MSLRECQHVVNVSKGKRKCVCVDCWGWVRMCPGVNYHSSKVTGGKLDKKFDEKDLKRNEKTCLFMEVIKKPCSLTYRIQHFIDR